MLGMGKTVKKDAGIVSKGAAADVLVFASPSATVDAETRALFERHLPLGQHIDIVSVAGASVAAIGSPFVLSLFVDPSQLDAIADAVLAKRQAGHKTTLIVAINSTQLAALGRWLDARANANKLSGTHLMLAFSVEDVARQLPERMTVVVEDNVIRMPVSPEIENTAYKNFFVFSPSLHRLAARIRGFAENGVTRAYLLGGPGAGKTSFAFYYWLQRAKGRFVSVNLAAEATGDKSAIKSLLCGHVSGAFPGAGARTGAFLQARDGVCFIDESHGVTGPVMEVLMEALDNGQYLPYGASAKQPINCAIIFASNRSWEHLQNAVNLDEFTRMGAAILEVPELHKREEDMIAIVATTLARLGAKCSSWKAPVGVDEGAWQAIRACRWHGNVRALVRVLEASFVDTASAGGGGELIVAEEIEHGIALWEPKTHHSHQIYAAA
jgi:transcriptional regulator with AAA-type ATPase domain